MRRRLFASVVLTTTLAVLLFALPLGYVVWGWEFDHARLQLERKAVEAASGLVPEDESVDPPNALPHQGSVRFALYDAYAQRLSGDGPDVGDLPVRAAINSRLIDRRHADSLVVAVPVTDGPSNAVVLRAETSSGVVVAAAAQSLGALGLIGVLAIGLSVLVARRQTRRLASPVEALGEAAQRLGDGDFTVTVPTTGIHEIDRTGQALATTAERLGHLLDRERSFTADASHQLRTPLTGLRLLVESELAAPREDRSEILYETLDQIERLDQITTQLLQLARDTPTDRGPLDIASLCEELERRWGPRLRANGRTLVLEREPVNNQPLASRSAIQHALDVLVDNAYRHGQGAVTVTCAPVDGGVAMTVCDEGPGVRVSRDVLFSRRAGGSGTGIGLALARSLTEAENGRLELLNTGPNPSFRLLLMTPK